MAEEATNTPSSSANGAEARQFLLQKVYLKDGSLEVPLAPDIFTRNWQPQIDVKLTTEVKPLGNDQFNCVLSITVTARLGTDVAFLVEVQQGGIFVIKGFANDQEVGAVLGVHCPSTLFPFARQAVADLVANAGFPQLLLQPINFEQLYVDSLNRQRAAAQAQMAAPADLASTH